ncbi:MAG: lysozyme [Nitrospinota bacterium]|nr:lysozyme [Nitrospinota bacterium]
MRTNQAGVELIMRFEGFEPDWYEDVVGVRTIGYGHTGDLPDGFSAPFTAEEGKRLLTTDLQRYEGYVEELVMVPLNENQYSALVSFTYNLGRRNLKESTLLRMLNWGDYQQAADQFPRWVFAGGKRWDGLILRRGAERKLFLSPV